MSFHFIIRPVMKFCMVTNLSHKLQLAVEAAAAIAFLPQEIVVCLFVCVSVMNFAKLTL